MPDDEVEDWSDIISREDLKREIDLDSYADDQVSELYGNNPPEVISAARQRLQAFVRKIRKHARPGDTWQEWVQGTEPSMQQGGLAVIRDEEIVWATMTRIS